MTFTADEAAFLATIREHPDADLPRLVFADWLEENGRAERMAMAELIRLQLDPLYAVPCGQVEYPIEDMPDIGVECLDYMNGDEEPAQRWCPQCKMRHRVMGLLLARETETERHVPYPFAGNGWTADAVHQYDRGMMREVRAPLAWMLGGEECECVRRWELHRVPPGEVIDGHGCYACHGTGRTPGHLPGLVAKWPITNVVVTDREPEPSAFSPGEVSWQSHARSLPSWVPHAVLLSMARQMGIEYDGQTWLFFTDRDAALKALSDAVLRLAKDTPSTTPPRKNCGAVS